MLKNKYVLVVISLIIITLIIGFPSQAQANTLSGLNTFTKALVQDNAQKTGLKGTHVSNTMSSQVAEQPAAVTTLPDLDAFTQALTNGKESELRGVYVANIMALRITEQPAADPAFVNPRANTATQFRLASEYGSIGLLAHNYQAGASFSLLQPDQVIYLVYGNGAVKQYVVSKILRFQAYEPENPNSRFLNLETSQEYSASEVFEQAYRGSAHLTLQTCIASGDQISWGRLFVIAQPN